jgi:hypothetical protein
MQAKISDLPEVAQGLGKDLETRISIMSRVTAGGSKDRDCYSAAFEQDSKRKDLEKVATDLIKISFATLQEALISRTKEYLEQPNQGFFHHHGVKGKLRATKLVSELGAATTIEELYNAIYNSAGGNSHQHSLDAYIARAMMDCVEDSGLRMSGRAHDKTVGIVGQSSWAPREPEYELSDFLGLALHSIKVREDYSTQCQATDELTTRPPH